VRNSNKRFNKSHGQELKQRQYWLSDCLCCKNNKHSNTQHENTVSLIWLNLNILWAYFLFFCFLFWRRDFFRSLFDLVWLFLVLWVLVLHSYLRCTVNIIVTTLLVYYQIEILYCWSSTLTRGWNDSSWAYALNYVDFAFTLSSQNA
jgi:hypothetical protein